MQEASNAAGGGLYQQQAAVCPAPQILQLQGAANAVAVMVPQELLHFSWYSEGRVHTLAQKNMFLWQ